MNTEIDSTEMNNEIKLLKEERQLKCRRNVGVFKKTTSSGLPWWRSG